LRTLAVDEHVSDSAIALNDDSSLLLDRLPVFCSAKLLLFALFTPLLLCFPLLAMSDILW